MFLNHCQLYLEFSSLTLMLLEMGKLQHFGSNSLFPPFITQNYKGGIYDKKCQLEHKPVFNKMVIFIDGQSIQYL